MTGTAALPELAATPRLLVALDFDGTLAPLQDEPMDARMLPEARAAVASLAALPWTWVALVSGRSLGDLRLIAEHDDRSPLLLAGSHGAEFWLPGQGAVRPVDSPQDLTLRDRLRTAAENATAHLPGVWIEPKTFGLGVHTRRADDADGREADRIVDALVAPTAPHWRRRTGHHIVEYAFREEGKDGAIARLRAHTSATAVLFAGDDVTDEDALRSLAPGDLGVHVGVGTATAATRVVADIPAMVALLEQLCANRSGASGIDCEHA